MNSIILRGSFERSSFHHHEAVWISGLFSERQVMLKFFRVNVESNRERCFSSLSLENGFGELSEVDVDARKKPLSVSFLCLIF